MSEHTAEKDGRLRCKFCKETFGTGYWRHSDGTCSHWSCEQSAEKDVQAQCPHRMAPDETNHPYWRFRCAVCGLRTRVIPPVNCSSCQGRGGDYYGPCWDCRGTGDA